MKRLFVILFSFFIAGALCAQSADTAATTDTAAAADTTASDSASKAGVSTVPAAKRPQSGTAKQIADIEAKPDAAELQKTKDTLQFGLETDITDVLDSLTKAEDIRFAGDIYDLFQVTKSAAVRQKVLEYFTALKDPCLEDYAVTILNDPYDEKQTTVDDVFRYVQAVKTKDAIPAVLTLLQNENQNYFDGALTTLGEIGGPSEALFLTGYLDRNDLTPAQKQSLVKVLGKIKAVQTYDKLASLAQDKDENNVVRMYSAEAIGAMEKKEAIPVLSKLYEETDPNLRLYVVKGLAHFSDPDAESVIIQAIRDSYYKVRIEAIGAAKDLNIEKAVPYIVFRVKNDPETVVKNACYTALATLNTKEAADFLVGIITDKKSSDDSKSKVAAALLEKGSVGTNEILVLAQDTLKDDRRKPLRYSLGKQFAKYGRPEFADICKQYLASSDVATQGTGLDIYAKGRYSSVKSAIQDLAALAAPSGDTTKTVKRNVNAEKAQRILSSEK